MPFALKDGVTVHVDEVPNGKDCCCVCPAYGDALLAKQGEEREDHFAHINKEDCKYGVESAIHYAAKEILARKKVLLLPSLNIIEPDYNKSGCVYWTNKEIQRAELVELQQVEVESIHHTIIPDIKTVVNGEKLLVEICVTHPIDKIKKQKISELKIDTLEIDLSRINSQITWEILEQVMYQYDIELKRWIYNRNGEKIYQDWEERVIREVTTLRSELAPNKIPWRSISDDIGFKFEEIPSFLNVPVPGELVYLRDRRVWQSAIYLKFILNRLSQSSGSVIFTMEEAVRYCYRLVPINMDWPNTYGAYVPEYIYDRYFPDLYKPIYHFLSSLVHNGFIIEEGPTDKNIRMRRFRVLHDQLSMPN